MIMHYGLHTPKYRYFNDLISIITSIVEKYTGCKFNTVLLNRYKNGKDYISAHKDKMEGWNQKAGFATLAFGVERKIKFKSDSK